jgi:hypothetical protein
MLRVTTPLLLALSLFTVARAANALIIVDYAFDSLSDPNTVLTLTSPVQLSIPPQGEISGEVQVTYTSDSLGNIADGPARLDILNLHADANISTTFSGQPITLVGPVDADLIDPVNGNLVGNQLGFGSAMASFHGFGSITCGGTICAFVNLPPGTPKAFDGTASVVMPTLTVGSLHGNITGLTFAIGGINVVATLHFDAPETGRMLPEPMIPTLCMLGLGLFGLARRSRA